jgi:pyruvate dehydrogenase E2 component (dihydrolipoamide acetyltransferase)
MPVNILMPALSPTMEKGNLAKWLKKEGDAIKSGDIIAEIETDKATMEVEAVDEGILAKIVVPEGTADVAVNEVIGVIAGEGEDAKSVSAPSAAPAKSEPAPKAAEPAPAAAAPAAAAPAPAAQAAAPASGNRRPLFASPLAAASPRTPASTLGRPGLRARMAASSKATSRRPPRAGLPRRLRRLPQRRRSQAAPRRLRRAARDRPRRTSR